MLTAEGYSPWLKLDDNAIAYACETKLTAKKPRQNSNAQYRRRLQEIAIVYSPPPIGPPSEWRIRAYCLWSWDGHLFSGNTQKQGGALLPTDRDNSSDVFDVKAQPAPAGADHVRMQSLSANHRRLAYPRAERRSFGPPPCARRPLGYQARLSSINGMDDDNRANRLAIGGEHDIGPAYSSGI